MWITLWTTSVRRSRALVSAILSGGSCRTSRMRHREAIKKVPPDQGPRETIPGVQNAQLLQHSPELLVQSADLLQDLSGSAVRLLFHVSGLENCSRGVCCAKARTLAERMGCSDRTIRRRWAELRMVGAVEKFCRRSRYATRGLTPLGRAIVDVIKAGGELAVSALLSAHKGEAEFDKNYVPCGRVTSQSIDANPTPSQVDPTKYRSKRMAGRLSEPAWSSIAAWLTTARSVSWARCKTAHRAFAGLVMAVHRSRDWRAYLRTVYPRHGFLSPDDLIRLAVDDAMRCKKDFGTVETATKYISAVVLACVTERRIPGERRSCR